LGTEEKDTNHTDVAQEKICDNPWNLWETFSQAKSVRICEICGKTFSSSVRRCLPQITQIYTDIGYGEKDTNHTDVAQEKICDNP